MAELLSRDFLRSQTVSREFRNKAIKGLSLARCGSFSFASLIGIRPGRVSHHDQVQGQGLKGKRGERSWKRLFKAL